MPWGSALLLTACAETLAQKHDEVSCFLSFPVQRAACPSLLTGQLSITAVVLSLLVCSEFCPAAQHRDVEAVVIRITSKSVKE